MPFFCYFQDVFKWNNWWNDVFSGSISMLSSQKAWINMAWIPQVCWVGWWVICGLVFIFLSDTMWYSESSLFPSANKYLRLLSRIYEWIKWTSEPYYEALVLLLALACMLLSCIKIMLVTLDLIHLLWLVKVILTPLDTHKWFLNID